MTPEEKHQLLNEIKALTNEHPFKHFYMRSSILHAIKNNMKIESSWMIGDKQSWIVGYTIDGLFHLYGANYSLELITRIKQNLDLGFVPGRLQIAGSKKLWDYIISGNPAISYTADISRCLYEVDKERFITCGSSPALIRNPIPADATALSLLIAEYQNEVYEAGASIAEFESLAFGLIQKNHLIIAEYEDQIVGFCGRSFIENDDELLGPLFVKRAYRKKYIAQYLLSTTTKAILTHNKKAHFYTGLANHSENRLVKTLGYENVFVHTSGEINIHPHSTYN